MSKTRIIFIDNIRLFGILLIILSHAISPYFDKSWWYIKFPSPESLFPLYFFKITTHAFVISLLFFIVGFFVAKSHKTASISVFLKKRALPMIYLLIFSTIFINPFLLFFYHQNRNSFDYGFWSYIYNDYIGFGIKPINWDGPTWPEFINLGHLWFLEYILIFTLSFILIRKAFLRLNINLGSFQRNPGHINVVTFTLLLAGLIFIIRIPFQSNAWLFPVLGIPIDPSFTSQYLVFFLLGILASVNNWDLSFPKVSKFYCLTTILICWFAIVYFYFYEYMNFWATKGVTLKSAYGSLIEAFLGVGLSILVGKVFKKYFNRPLPLHKYTRYTIGLYFLHLPIVVAVNPVVAQTGLNIFTQILLLFLITLTISILIIFLVLNLIKAYHRLVVRQNVS